MRIAALAGLLVAATGCNQIFGLDTTSKAPPIDAIDAAPPVRPITLTWQVERTTAAGAAVELTPISPAPEVAYGPMPATGMPLIPASIDGQGVVLVPDELRGHLYRFVYKVPGDPVPHEIQSALTDVHYTVPLFGPIDRTAVPASSGYRIHTSAVATVALPRFMTTGIWTQTVGAQINDTNTGFITYSNAVSMSGPLAPPDLEPGYSITMCDAPATDAAGHFRTVGCATTQIAPLVASMLADPAAEPTWKQSARAYQLAVALSGPTGPDARLIAALGPLYTAGQSDSVFDLGAIPSTQMPSFTFTPAKPLTNDDAARPVMHTYARLTDTANSYVDPDVPGTTAVVHARVSNRRMVAGRALVSAVQSVTVLEPTGPTAVTFAASVPRTVKLGDTALDTDDRTITIAGNAIDLTWVPDGIDGATADDHLVTLYAITGGELVPVRTWQVFGTPPVVSIAAGDLAPATTYVLEIAARRGFPQAGTTGDLTQVAYPFARSSVFTSTFHL